MLTVEEFMTAEPVTLSRYQSLADARRTMREHRFRHLPVVDDDGQLIGLVSYSDVLEHSIPSQELAEPGELQEIESGTLIADIMETDLTTIPAVTGIAEAARLIYRRKFGCLPVVDAEKRLVGIITDHDFVAITLQLLDIMADSEPPEEAD